jgi:hypothetical protein
MRAVVLALSLLAAPAFAQAPGATPPVGGPAAQPPGPPQPRPPLSRADKIKQQVRERRAFELTDALELDEKTAGRMFAVFGRYDDQFDKLLAARAVLQGKLNGADQIRDPKVLEKLIDDAVANQRAFWDLEEHRLTELRTILTPQQIAKLIVVLPQLERRLQNQLQKAITNANNPKPRPRGRRQLGDDDDD